MPAGGIIPAGGIMPPDGIIPGGGIIPPGGAIPPCIIYIIYYMSIPGGNAIPPGPPIPPAAICYNILAMSYPGGGPIRAGVKFLTVLFLLVNDPVEFNDCSCIMLFNIYSGFNLKLSAFTS